MVDFDKPLVEVLDVWLGASSANHKICLMFKVCDIKTYDMFCIMGTNTVAALERIISQTPTKLKEVHSIRIYEILSFIQFLETIDELIADYPFVWKVGDYRKWKRDGTPRNINVTPTTLPPTGNTATSTQTKQQKVDDDMLMGWKRTRKDARDYPVLNGDQYYTELFHNMR